MRITAITVLFSLLLAPTSSFAQVSLEDQLQQMQQQAQEAQAAQAQAAAEGFPDVPKKHPAYQAVVYLKAQGIISGKPDGRFAPDEPVTRAAAAKLIVAPLVNQSQLAGITSSKFADVPDGSWFLPYVELMRITNIIDGPPEKTTFNGARPVITAEFLKMLQLAHGVNPQQSLSDIQLPLSVDVTSPSEWFYPYMRFGIASSQVRISKVGTLDPGKALTRADTAQILFHFLMYKQGRRVQALLSQSEEEIVIILKSLERGDIKQAQYASTRSLLYSRGAKASRPNESIVNAALKISESFVALVRAYEFSVQGKYDDVITLSGQAWNLSGDAIWLSNDLEPVGKRVQTTAKQLADNARKKKEELEARAQQGGSIPELIPQGGQAPTAPQLSPDGFNIQ